MELFIINYPQEQILGGKKIYVHSITLRPCSHQTPCTVHLFTTRLMY